MNIADLLILILIAAAVFFAVRRIRKNRRSGGCGCGCADCPARSGICRTGASGSPRGPFPPASSPPGSS